jgi:hypothetical protein
MLMDAQRYVVQYPTEFLILKFSKSFGWPAIFTMCKNVLGNDQYRPQWGWQNLNMATVGNLAGKVVTIFPDSLIAEMRQSNVINIQNQNDWGLLPFTELYNKKTKTCNAYSSIRNGLQYFGKFSSTSDIAANTKKQTKLMVSGGTTADPAVVGMMYWTTTGLIANIRERNDRMWTGPSQTSLANTWSRGLESSIRNQLGQKQNLLDVINLNHGNLLKSFMPNIVMMDFSNRTRCDTVYALNTVTANDLNQMIDRHRPAVVENLRKQQERIARAS